MKVAECSFVCLVRGTVHAARRQRHGEESAYEGVQAEESWRTEKMCDGGEMSREYAEGEEKE